jgi:hypothetical protein
LNPVGGQTLVAKIYKNQLSKVHEKSVDYKHSVARWEDIHFPQHANAPPVLQGLNIMVDIEQLRIITVMKVLYFTIWNDRSILSFQDTCQLLSLLQTPNMHVNDEYNSYSSRYATLEFLWAISKYLNDKFLSEAQSSPFFSLMIDEVIDRTLEQRLIVYNVYLSNNGKDLKL